MISKTAMLLLILERHLIFSRSDGRGGTIQYYYYDQITWVVAALAVAWVVWLVIRRYRYLRTVRRPRRRVDDRLLKRIVRVKDDLTSRFLHAGLVNNIHAVGVGRLAVGGDYYIQVFVNDATQELWPGAGASPLPGSFRGVPLVLVEMSVAGFLSDSSYNLPAALGQYANGIRDQQAVIIGGISGANVKLDGQSGTIGYFCTRRSKLLRRKEVFMLSNSHVFVDLQDPKATDADLIVQPSPGERASNRPIGKLTNFSPLKFDADTSEPNTIDAAIGKLWEPQPHERLIPLIGAIKGYVQKRDVEVGEPVRKFGRSTGYTEGRVFSIYLDIWIRYDRTGRAAFFTNQFLIAPTSPAYEKFVTKGDSGSLLVDAEQRAVGLIFAGASQEQQVVSKRHETQRIEGYGVANPISDVLDGLKIDLL